MDQIEYEKAKNCLSTLKNYIIGLTDCVKQQEKLLDSYRDFIKSLDVQIVSSQRVLINVEDYELSDSQIKKIKKIKELENDTN